MQKPQKKKRKNEKEIELEKKQEEEYNNEVHEQRYKRLMHLLRKSKFFSSYLINKIEGVESKNGEITKKRKRAPVNDENVSPLLKKKKIKTNNVGKYNIQEYISTEVSNEIWTLG